uniref:ABC-F family ATP-binding cassette domain-containing protein n=1 Tax=Romboutsia ilealis TaxID=1115758 RepID=UPI00272B2AE3
MLQVTNVGLRFGDKELFKDVNLKFTKGNCYGIIGANGAGKSTFLKILAGDIEANTGSVSITEKERMSVLRQDHFKYEEDTVLNVVIMGHERLYQIMQEKDALYMKPDFSEEDGIKAAELEGEFAELDGWDAETNAERLLMGLGITKDLHYKQMKELTGGEKVKVLLAQALFGKPEILIMDEPTNHLDFQSINWLNNFIMDLEDSIVIVVSHDRHFLNQICTNIVDVDFGKIQMYVGNYDFWYESSQLALQLAKDQNKKAEEKIAQLKEFIARFSSNASKAKQATSRKKQLEKIQVEEIQPSRRRYPYVGFTPEREIGNEVLEVEGLTKTVDGVKVLDNVSFRLDREDKVAFMGDEIAITTLFNILMGEDTADSGTFKWGVTTSQSYLPKNHNQYFDGVEYSLVDWLRQYSEEKSESFIRGFLGRMLFSGEEALKQAQVLSGGEKVRCMLSKLMLSNANVLVLDDPTNHLDLESITSVNKGLEKFPGVLLFNSHDQEMIQTLANRIIEITPGGIMDRKTTLEEYLENKDIQHKKKNECGYNSIKENGI